MSERLEMRGYQRDGYGRTAQAFAQGAKGVVLVMPTGGGKTLMGAYLVESAIRQGHGVEWYAHRAELIDQARARLRAQGIPLDRVRVTTVQTEIAQGAARRPWALPAGKKVIRVLDEAHHYVADEWQAVAQGDSPVLGLTATPERGDGRGLGRACGGPFDAMVQVATVRELQALGVLVPCVTYAPGAPTKELSQDPVAFYSARLAGERALVFCSDVKHAEKLTMRFATSGIPAVCVHGSTRDDLRRARLEAFASQEVHGLRMVGTMEKPPLVICNAHLLTEGLDVTAISGVILARGCGHAGAMLQMVGRGLRAHPGKERCVFGDLRGVTRKRWVKGPRAGKLILGLPEDDRIWRLEGKSGEVSGEDAERPLHTCEACDATVRAWATDAEGWRVCPVCRHKVTRPEPDVPAAPRELHAYGSGAPEAELQKALRAIAKDAARYGWKPAAVALRFAERFAIGRVDLASGRRLDVPHDVWSAANAALKLALAERAGKAAKPRRDPAEAWDRT